MFNIGTAMPKVSHSVTFFSDMNFCLVFMCDAFSVGGFVFRIPEVEATSG
jgi:hypothetical protein